MSEKAILSVCAIMKDEAPYLLEWLEFHKIVGVQRFYLYENGDGGDVAGILQPYLESGELILHDWPLSPGQLLAYEHCLRTYNQDSEWIAFIDLDEFLFPTIDDNLRDILREFSSAPGVGVNWLMFGTSGHQTRPDGLQIENFIQRAETDFLANRHIKSIVRPDRVFPPADPHFFSCKAYEQLVTEEHLPLSSAMSDYVSVSKLRINHYFTRSREDMYQKLLRGRSDGGPPRTWELLESADRNEVEDLTIQRFLPQLKQAVAARSEVTNLSFAVVPEIKIECDNSLLWTGNLDYPRVNWPIYGSTLFVAGWVISKHTPIAAIRVTSQNNIITEIPVNISRPDVLAIYPSLAESAVLGFQGTLNLSQLCDQDIIRLQAVFIDYSLAFYGYLKIYKGSKSDAYPTTNREALSCG